MTTATMSPQLKTELKAWMPLVVLAGLLAMDVLAGSDTTFQTPTDKIAGWMTGSLGKMAATGALAVGVITAMVTHKLHSAAIAGGIALVAAIGPGVVSGMFSLGL
ncbi:MAG: hypothetical protein NT159_07265 [Proteobacteria bacterium]|nr:hypothetical protein [Pseudomonadota bacterium]